MEWGYTLYWQGLLLMSVIIERDSSQDAKLFETIQDKNLKT